MTDQSKKYNLWKILLVCIAILFVFNIVLSGIGKQSGRYSNFSVSGGSAVALIKINGAISRETTDSVFYSLRSIAKNPDIKGILLQINSPGGTTGTSEEIYNELMKLKQKGIKIVATIGDLGASGGYYIASAADTIVANASSLTGSIGVIMSTFNVKDLTNKLGIKVVNLTSGNMKDMLSPFKDISPSDVQYVKGMITQIYNQFVDDVLKGRGDKIKRETLLSVADGRVMTGTDAHKVGLVDVIGGYSKAQEEMQKLLKTDQIRYVTFTGNQLSAFLKQLGLTKSQFSQELSVQELTRVFLNHHVNTPLYFSPLGGVY